MGDLIAAIVVAGLTGGGLATVINKLLDKKASDVTTLREIIAEVRDDKARDEERINQLEGRVRKLEERERHMLTRAAVHEAWDSLTFQAILASNPNHPPPPPLRPTPIEATDSGLSDDGNPA